MKLLNQEQFNNAKKEEGLKVVDFFATWCGPCKMLTPVLEELSAEMTNGVDFIKIDIDESMELAMEYQVTTVPTLVFIKDGKEVNRKVGFSPKAVLKDEIEKYI